MDLAPGQVGAAGGDRALLRAGMPARRPLGSERHWTSPALAHFEPALDVDLNFGRTLRHIEGERLTTRPADPELLRSTSATEHLHHAVLGPISAAAVDFACRPKLTSALDPELRADAPGISLRPFEPYPETGFRLKVLEQARLGRVLRHDQVHTTVSIEIRHRGSTLLAINQNTAFGPRHSSQLSMTIASQPKTAAGVVSGRLGFDGKEILAEENVFATIAVIIGNHNRERGRELRFERKRFGSETGTLVHEDHGFQAISLENLSFGQPVAQDFLNSGVGIGLKGRKPASQRRQCPRRYIQAPLGNVLPHLGLVIRFEQAEHSFLIEIG